MIVATYAAERHGLERHSDFGDLRVDVVGFHLRLVRLDDLDVADHQKAGCRDVLGPFFW